MSLWKRATDVADNLLCRIGVLKPPTWDNVALRRPLRLYAGKVSRKLPQYRTHFGITPFFPSSRNIPHDVRLPYPIPDDAVEVYQSEDVFEHLPLNSIVPLFDEIYRVLSPGGLFRLSLPDYHFDLYRNRTLVTEGGELLFDPGGGGRLVDGEVTDGGHLWFPTIDLVRELFAQSRFGKEGRVSFLHYNAADGTFHVEAIDYSLGNIQRTPDYDSRVANDRRPISIVVDAYKSSAQS